MPNVSEYWNKSHEEFTLKDKDVSAYAEDREKEFPRNSTVADIGGGQGADAEYFLKHGHAVMLLDTSAVALKLAQQKIEGLNLQDKYRGIEVELGEENIPLPDESVDVIFSRLALHFFNAAKTELVVKEMYRILKNGGAAYVTVKSPDDTQDNVREIEYLQKNAEEISSGVFLSDEGLVKSRFTKEQWLNILAEAGIEDFEVSTYTEDLSTKNDQTKSGATKLLMNEVVFRK